MTHSESGSTRSTRFVTSKTSQCLSTKNESRFIYKLEAVNSDAAATVNLFSENIRLKIKVPALILLHFIRQERYVLLANLCRRQLRTNLDSFANPFNMLVYSQDHYYIVNYYCILQSTTYILESPRYCCL